MPSSATKKLSLPIPDEMHRELFDESRRTGVPATKLARSALEEWLRRRRRERRQEEVHQFAIEHAGTDYDLDTQIESVAADELRDFDEDDRETR